MAERSRTEGLRPPRLLAPGTLVLLAALAVAGCSWAPGQADAVPGQDQAFPKLSSVPDRPQPTSTPEERQAVMERLILERDRARHGGEALRRSAPPPAPTPAATPPPGPSSALTAVPACHMPRRRAKLCFPS